MSEPPSRPEHGNVVDPDVLARRRARRAEVGEDATLELRLFDAEQQLREVEAERDALRALLEVRERRADEGEGADESGDGAAEAEEPRSAADVAALAVLRERLADADTQIAALTTERDRARSALRQARTSAEAAAARRAALEREHAALRAELDRRSAVARDAAAAVAGARRALSVARASGVDATALAQRLERETAAFAGQVAGVEEAVVAVRTHLVAAIGALRERVEGERERRAAAEAALAAERERRATAEAARVSEREARASAEAGMVAEREARAAAEWELASERDARAALEARLEGEREGRLAAEAVLGDERAARADVEGTLTAEREARTQLAGRLTREARGRADAQAAAAAEREARALVEARLEAEAQGRAEAEERLSEASQARADAERALSGERQARSEAEAALTAERDAARAEQERLEQELARQVALEATLRGELDGVRAELGAVRSGTDERTGAMAARVEAVAALAGQLRDGIARERTAEVQALVASLEAMQARIDALQETVAETARLRQELEAERAARWAAEAELDAERARAAEDRAAREGAEARLAEVEAELEELRTAGRVSADPDSIASLRDALGQLRAVAPAEAAAPSLSLDLAAAAARLRAAAGAEPDAAAEPDAVAEGGAVAAPGAVAHPRADAAAQAPFAPLPARTPIATRTPWLRDTLVALAAEEPDIAELLVTALLPAQAGIVRKPLTYDLVPDGGLAQRVVLTPDRVRLETPGDGPEGASVRVAGPLAALVPLAAGGARRRLPGARVERRRALRRLLRARRAPLGLAELAAAGTAPSPGLLLTVLARAVDPAWIAGEALAVDVAPQGAERWRVLASGDGPLAVLPATAPEPAAATVHVAPGRLAAVLAATAAPTDAWVEGDPAAAGRLLSWLDRAQRGER